MESESSEDDGAEEMRLTAEEEWIMLPEWRREAARERVRRLREALGGLRGM
jgi:hypothetical protein